MDRLVTAPSLHIVLELESAPKVRACFEHEGDELRMGDWLAAHPALRKMVDRALALAEREQAA